MAIEPGLGIRMQVLLLTGQIAFPHAQEIVQAHQIPAKVLALPVSVASFITPEMVTTTLREVTLSQYDLVLLPGLVPWDASKLETSLGIHIRKGPQNIDDVPDLFKRGSLDDLSPKSSSDALFTKRYDDEYAAFLKKQEKKAKTTGLPRNFTLVKSPLTIGMDVPPRVMAQVMNATRLPEEEVLATARFFVEKGAEIIDIGGEVQAAAPAKLARIISLIHSELKVPIAVDSMRPEDILAGVAAGAELVLSVDLGNISVLGELPKDIAVVLIPTNVADGKFPVDPLDRVQNIHKLVAKCREAGINRILADPLLGAPIQPGLIRSLEAYAFLHDPGPTGLPLLEVPLLLGAENVFEMVDIDSPGVNGLLASIGVELQAGVILVTEYSPKTQNTIEEFHRGIELACRAKMKRAPPKDLGISLLVLKSKGKNPLPRQVLKEAILIPTKSTNFTPDPAGYFKIYSSYRTGQVIVAHYSNTHDIKGIFASESSETLCKYLIRQKHVTRLDHAAYLGRELAKAETCAKTGGNYFQVD